MDELAFYLLREQKSPFFDTISQIGYHAVYNYRYWTSDLAIDAL